MKNIYDKLSDAHIIEAERKGAEFYNLGWASGYDFIHSKTDKGRLFTTIVNGEIVHEWQDLTGKPINK